MHLFFLFGLAVCPRLTFYQVYSMKTYKSFLILLKKILNTSYAAVAVYCIRHAECDFLGTSRDTASFCIIENKTK